MHTGVQGLWIDSCLRRARGRAQTRKGGVLRKRNDDSEQHALRERWGQGDEAEASAGMRSHTSNAGV